MSSWDLCQIVTVIEVSVVQFCYVSCFGILVAYALSYLLQVINVYLELLKEREKRDPKKFLRCHFFNTFFYKKAGYWRFFLNFFTLNFSV